MNYMIWKFHAADGPKTSEYKYFKKILGDNGHSYPSHPPQRQDNHLKEIEANTSRREMNNMVRGKSQANRPSTLRRIAPVDLNSPVLQVGASRTSDAHELLYRHGEVFSRKRQELLQLAAGTLSLQVDEFCSKRSDFISELLLRLGIDSNKSNQTPELDMHFKELPQPPRTCLLPYTSQHNVQNAAVPGLDMHFEELPQPPRTRLLPYAAQHNVQNAAVPGLDMHFEELPQPPRTRLLPYAAQHNVQNAAVPGLDMHFEERPQPPRLCLLPYTAQHNVQNSAVPGLDMHFEELPQPPRTCLLPYTAQHNVQKTAVPGLDMHFEELPQPPRTCLLPYPAQHNVEKDPPYFWSGEAEKSFHSSWDGFDANSLSTGISYETCMPLKRSQSDRVPYGRRSASLQTNRKSIDVFYMNTESLLHRYGNSTLNNKPSGLDWQAAKSLPSPLHPLDQSLVQSNVSSFSELNTIDNKPNDHALAVEWCPLHLLGWDDRDIETKPKSATAHHGMEMTFKPNIMLPNSIGYDHQWNFNSAKKQKTLCSPSMLPICLPSNFSSDKLFSDCHNIHDEEDYLVEEADDFPPITSHIQNYLALTKDFRFSNDYRWSDIISSPHGFHVSEVFREKIYPSMDVLPATNRLDLESRQKSLLSTNSFGECHSLSHSSLQLGENKTGQNVHMSAPSRHTIEKVLDDSRNEDIQTHFGDDTLEFCCISPLKLLPSEKMLCHMSLDRSSWYGTERE